MISKQEVYNIAHLSRIQLTDNEAEFLTKDLEKILHYFEKLNKLDVSKIEPTSHVLPLKNVFREDTVRPSLDNSSIMAMANSHQKGSYKVPKVIK